MEIEITTPSWEDLIRHTISTSLLINSAWDVRKKDASPNWIALREGKSIHNGIQEQQLAKRRDGRKRKEPKTTLSLSTVKEESEGRSASLALTMWYTIQLKRRITIEAASSNMNGIQGGAILDAQYRILNKAIIHEKTVIVNSNCEKMLQPSNQHSLYKLEASLFNVKWAKTMESSQVQLLHLHRIACSLCNGQILNVYALIDDEGSHLLVIAPRRFWSDEGSKQLSVFRFQFRYKCEWIESMNLPQIGDVYSWFSNDSHTLQLDVVHKIQALIPHCQLFKGQ